MKIIERSRSFFTNPGLGDEVPIRICYTVGTSIPSQVSGIYIRLSYSNITYKVPIDELYHKSVKDYDNKRQNSALFSRLSNIYNNKFI